MQFSGGNGREETPVPIPNTEVKISSADGTAWATVWESKTLPGITKRAFPLEERPFICGPDMSCSIEIHVLYFNPEFSVDGYCRFWVKLFTSPHHK